MFRKNDFIEEFTEEEKERIWTRDFRMICAAAAVIVLLMLLGVI